MQRPRVRVESKDLNAPPNDLVANLRRGYYLISPASHWQPLIWASLGAWVPMGCSRDISKPTVKPSGTSALLPIQDTVDLGILFQGESTVFDRWLKNTSGREVHVDKIEKSCECVDMKLSKSHLAPGERVLGVFTYDGNKELDFVGALAIEISLLDVEGNKAGRIEVPVEVVSKKEFPCP